MSDPEKPPQQIEMEIKITFLENTLTELNQIVYKQQKTIDELGQTIQKLTGRIEELETSGGGDIPHLKPPHY